MSDSTKEDIDGEEITAQVYDDTEQAPLTKTGEDGTVYYLDVVHNMWLPQVNEDLIRQQQEAYGGTPSAPPVKVPKRKYNNNKKLKPGEEPAVMTNPNDLYVEGLPSDMTMDEFVDYFSKAGIVRKDPETGVVKAKIYKTPEGTVKGDGLICYFKKESVDLALSILDGAEIRKGYPLKLSVAKFVQKPEVKKKKKKNNKRAKKLVDQQKDLGWDEKESLYVVIKNMFEPKESLEDADFFKDLKEDITKECGKYGPVDKVSIFEHNPEGVVVVKFKDSESAEKCLTVMSGRFFAGKKLQAEYYDGVSNYHVEESDEIKELRLKKWNSWLDGDDDEKSEKTEKTEKKDD